MKAGTIIGSIIWAAVFASLAVWLFFEHQARSNLVRENSALRQQLSRTDDLVGEKQRLWNLIANTNRSAGLKHSDSAADKPLETPSVANERTQELLRLRSLVAALRQQTREMESLRADTQRLRAVRENQGFSQAQAAGSGIGSSSPQLEILKADYGTANTNMDVRQELSERIRGDTLKAIASNNLKGDPEFGQVKHLTVVFRLGGVICTNEFQEGDFVVIPRE